MQSGKGNYYISAPNVFKEAILMKLDNKNRQPLQNFALVLITDLFSFEGYSTKDLWQEFKDIAPHAEYIANSVSSANISSDYVLILAKLLNNLAVFCYSIGHNKQGKRYIEQSLSLRLREKNLPSEHPDIISSLDIYGLLLAALNNFEEAQKCFEKALRINKQLLGPEHPKVISNLTNLGKTLYAQGKYKLAENYLREGLSLCRKLKLYLIDSLDLTRFVEGLQKLDITDSIFRLGEDLQKLDITDSLARLAEVLQKQGNYSEAEMLYQELLELQIADDSEENHEDKINTLIKLVEILIATRKDNEATIKMGVVLKEMPKMLEKNLNNVTMSISALHAKAQLFHSQGKFNEANETYKLILQELADLEKDQVKMKSFDLLKAEILGNFAKTLQMQGNYSDAENNFRGALALQEKTLLQVILT